MPERITLASIVVIRDGNRVRPKLNEPFNYTKEEITSILEGHPAALRMPINESKAKADEPEDQADEPETEDKVEKPAKAPAKAASKPAKDDDDL